MKPVIRSKAAQPKPRPNGAALRYAPRNSASDEVERIDIVRRCLAVRGGSVVLFEAPAGYGKTTVFKQWHTRLREIRHPAIWVRLRSTETAWQSFATLLAGAMGHAGLSALRLKVRAADSMDDRRMQRFIEELAASFQKKNAPATLFLDDYQNAAGPSLDRMLQELVDQIPDCLTVAIASRHMIQFPVSRWLVQDRLVRFDKRTLLFSKEEIRASFGGLISPAELQRVHALTEGWPAAVKITRLCLDDWRREQCPLDTLPAYATLIGNFCHAEVLASVESDTAALLMDASAFETIEPDLCDAVRQSDDSAEQIMRLAGRETFLDVASTATNSWRIPAVLRWCLARRARELNSARLATIHLHAAERYEARGDTLQAVRHYLAAGEGPRAAEAFERVSPMGIATLYGDRRADEILRLIPSRYIGQFPRLALCRAYLDYKEGFLDEARYTYEDVAARTDNFTVDRDGACDGLLKAESLAAALVLDLYRLSCCSTEFLASAEESIAHIFRVTPRVAAFAHVLVGQFYKIRGDFEAAATHFIQGEKFTTREPAPWTELWLKYHRGSLALANGHMMEVKYHIHSALKTWRKDFTSYKAFGAAAGLILAEIDYENNALDEAQRKVDEALYTVENTEGWHEHYATAYEIAVMILVHRGSVIDAEALIMRATGIKRVSAILEDFLGLLRLRIVLLTGSIPYPNLAAEIVELGNKWTQPQCHDKFSWRSWDLAGICLTHAALQRGSLAEASDILTRLEGVVRRNRRCRTLAKVLTLRSVVSRLEGDLQAAVGYMVQALELANTQGYRRTILDEGPIIRPVLDMVALAGPPAPARFVALASKLLALIQTESGHPVDGSSKLLSERETEVIQELNRGHSNKVISRNLALREPTVKFHVKNIFRKLAVRKREAAVAEAKRRGLLAGPE
jgi:LuxR family maltose regulon positive regulatory protein